MRFSGTHTLISGERRPYRMTFTPQTDGSVHQFIEESSDGGNTWAVWFDGTYKRQQSKK